MKYLVVTIKDWNIEEYKEYSNKFKGEWHLITNKEELTLGNLKRINPEYIFFPHWSWMVPQEIVDNFECVCFHMTDLPYGRGGSPLQNLIIKGCKETKITALKMTQELDAGGIYRKTHLSLHGSAQEIFVRASKKISKLNEGDLIQVTFDLVTNKSYVFAKFGPHKGYVIKPFLSKK